MNIELEKAVQEQLSQLEKVASDYKEFCEIAETIEWIDIYEEHYDWFKEYPFGIMVTFFAFPENYLKENLAKAYVRAILATMAFYEEWEKDFWNIGVEERRECLIKGEELYARYAIPDDFRFKKVTCEYLKEEILFYGNYNKVEIELLNQCMERVEDSVIIELGGSYGGDYNCLVVKADSLMTFDYGMWD